MGLCRRVSFWAWNLSRTFSFHPLLSKLHRFSLWLNKIPRSSDTAFSESGITFEFLAELLWVLAKSPRLWPSGKLDKEGQMLRSVCGTEFTKQFRKPVLFFPLFPLDALFASAFWFLRGIAEVLREILYFSFKVNERTNKQTTAKPHHVSLNVKIRGACT